jgi:hypothetical protein
MKWRQMVPVQVERYCYWRYQYGEIDPAESGARIVLN